jgi:putative PIN family toxin of toxin-antitoxin system
MMVIDTNVLLDIWIYSDPATAALREHLLGGQLQWISTMSMREELVRVLDYEHIVKRRFRDGISAIEVMKAFDRYSCCMKTAPRSGYVCKDPDDQKFIDLAVAHQAILLSKDRQVLKMAKRLALAGVRVAAKWEPFEGLNISTK